MTDALKGREIILEYYPVGNAVKVSAVDSQTLTEVSIQGPASAGEAALQQGALKKLEYVLRKKGLLE